MHPSGPPRPGRGLQRRSQPGGPDDFSGKHRPGRHQSRPDRHRGPLRFRSGSHFRSGPCRLRFLQHLPARSFRPLQSPLRLPGGLHLRTVGRSDRHLLQRHFSSLGCPHGTALWKLHPGVPEFYRDRPGHLSSDPDRGPRPRQCRPRFGECLRQRHCGAGPGAGHFPPSGPRPGRDRRLSQAL